MSDQQGNLPIEIDEENYTLLLTDVGGVVYNADDKTKAMSFSIADLTNLVYGENKLAGGSGLLYPVTRHFNSTFNSFIIERPPSTIKLSLNKKTRYFKMPWCNYNIWIDNDFNVKSIQIFFRPLAAVTKYEKFYCYPTPFTDDSGFIDSSIIENINLTIKKEKDMNLAIFNTMRSIFEYISKNIEVSDEKIVEDFLPEAFAGNGIETYKDFCKFLDDVPLEKLLFIDYKPFTITKDLVFDNSSELHCDYKYLIDYINNKDIVTHKSFFELIKSILLK